MCCLRSFFFPILKDIPWLPVLCFYGTSVCASVYISATAYVSLDLFFCLFLLSYSSLFVFILLIYLMSVCLLKREGEKRDCRFWVGREVERIWYEANGVNQDQNILYEKKIYFHFKIENICI